MHTFHLHQKFLIVVTKSVRNISDDLRTIFEIVMKLGLVNVNVLIEEKGSHVWSLHLYNPYAQNCHSFDTKMVESFSPHNFTNESKILFNNLFPVRHFNFHKCKLFIATFSLEPFVIIRNSSNGTLEFDGVDVIIVNEISITLNLMPTYIHKTRGRILENGTATGAVKMVYF